MAGKGERVFRWAPWVSEHGWYAVWVRWPAGENRAANARYRVAHADGSFVERRDQRADDGQWVRLGGDRVFRFLPGRGGGVILDNDADGAVAADAVKLVLYARLGPAGP
jgi:hypothetical protein